MNLTENSPQLVRDRLGRPYEIVVTLDGPVSRFRLYERKTLVGEAKCLRCSVARMELGDIAIANEAIPTPANGLMQRFRQIPGCQHAPVNYRGRGLGTVLLQHLVNHARSAGAQELWGEVFQQDIENDPGLLNWYQNFGFERHSPSTEVGEDVVALICFALDTIKSDATKLDATKLDATSSDATRSDATTSIS